MSTGTSIFVVRWINFFTMILAIAVICFGIWMSTHHDACRRTLTLPVMGLGALILLVSLIGFLGAWKNITILLWAYLVILFLILVAIMVFTVLAFIITNNGSGHAVAGLRYKEYHLHDYSPWFLKQLNNTKNWRRLKSCLVKTEDCNKLPKKYKTLKEYKLAELTPIEAGCCRPPSEAGVAQYMKIEWRVVAIFNVILFVILSAVYFVGCCARRNAEGSRSSKVRGR
ncbi:tetraspanin-10 isoform X3 [Elaeis guineensis]|uniref:tetraspanin-10 isoform X3 n=1 Tax=Elaeis guineensis var. tenera TaxID=51953 RepID=UPI003C6D39C1